MATYPVPETELAEFERAIWAGCALASPERLENQDTSGFVSSTVPTYFRAASGELVLSFDRGWFPFLCNSKGWNKGPDKWYVPKASTLIRRLAEAMRAARKDTFQPGGRIFLDEKGAVTRPDGRTSITVLDWSLSRASEILPPRTDHFGRRSITVQ